MKIHLLTLILLMSLAGCAGSGAAGKPHGDCAYREEFLSYADALNEYAKVMPVIGQDTEALWASSEVQAMRDSIAEGALSVRESLAMIYRMQTMAAYGLTYESSVFGLYTDESENAAYAMHSAAEFNTYYTIERNGGFQRDSSLCLLGDLSFFYSQMFAKLYNALEDKQVFSTDAFGSSLPLYGHVCDLVEDGLEPSDILRVQTVFDGYSFFQAYVPLIQGFCISEETHARQYPVIIDAAHFFDDHYKRMLKACGRGVNSVQALLEREFEDFVTESLRYRVELLGFLTENIRGIDEARREDSTLTDR